MDGVPVGPPRVWLATADSPGLSMSRAFGDALAASVGVTDEPDLVDVALGPADRYLLLASDGVFEFMEARAPRRRRGWQACLHLRRGAGGSSGDVCRACMRPCGSLGYPSLRLQAQADLSAGRLVSHAAASRHLPILCAAAPGALPRACPDLGRACTAACVSGGARPRAQIDQIVRTVHERAQRGEAPQDIAQHIVRGRPFSPPVHACTPCLNGRVLPGPQNSIDNEPRLLYELQCANSQHASQLGRTGSHLTMHHCTHGQVAASMQAAEGAAKTKG